jgi:Phosphotransferase enzyme family
MLASDSVRPSESLRAENVAELNVMAAKFRSNTEILRGLELLLKPTLGARVRHLRSETVIPPRADLQAYIHTGRTHTKHILQVMGDVKPEWAERITDGTISIFVKAGPKVPCSPLEAVLNGANAEDFRPPHFFGYVEHGRLYVSVWEFIEGQRTPFEDLPIATLKRLVRAIACVNAIGAAPGVPRKTKWVSEPLDWYEKRFQRLAGGDQAKWQGALERLRRLLAQGDVVQNFISGEGEQLLTHNDIHPNNVFTPAEGDIVIFDWEGATLSVPGADLRFLARMNDRDILLETYIERMCELGYGLAAADVQRTVEIIESFRLIFRGWAKQNKLRAVLNALSMAERHIGRPP